MFLFRFTVFGGFCYFVRNLSVGENYWDRENILEAIGTHTGRRRGTWTRMDNLKGKTSLPLEFFLKESEDG